jgi:hypothetical protein
VFTPLPPWRHDPEGAAIGKLEDLTAGALVTGIVPGEDVTVVAVSWHGQEAVTLTYQEPKPGVPVASLPCRRA